MTINTRLILAATLLLPICMTGCSFQHHKRPSVTAYPAIPMSECDRPGIPFYLPKPLLVVSKNVQHIETAKVGLTSPAPIPDSFDKQETYGQAQLNSDVKLPSPTNPNPVKKMDAGGGAQTVHSTDGAPVAPGDKIPSDGLAPHTFFTYEIVFVPDMTQKYVMHVEGGAGEIRAAMNLVNGWQFTGLGPYYMKDSSTAQNIFARGVAINLGLTGGADVVNSFANLAQAAAAGGGQTSAAHIAALANAMNTAAAEETVDWKLADSTNWEDETVPVQAPATDVNGNPILDATGQPQWITKYVKTGRKFRHRLEKHAEIYVYEPHVEGDRMIWLPVAQHEFDREYLGLNSTTKNVGGAAQALGQAMNMLGKTSASAAPASDLDIGRLPSVGADPALVRDVVGKTIYVAPPAPKKKGFLHFLHHRKVENRTVHAPLPPPEPQ